ncbi:MULTISPECIES: hypothetical protein [unclassified Streptomyces]|uniref:hypothetical protein n=1 Tax=unclassified Streptomyces TaxID=2593676 RepID=UPI0035D61514
MRKIKRAAALFTTVAAMTMGAVAAAPAASAGVGPACPNDGYNHNCLNLFYNSNFGGAGETFWDTPIPNFEPYKFEWPGLTGAGLGQSVKNHAASGYTITMGWPSKTWATIYFNSNYGGACDAIAPDSKAYQLHYTYNNNASMTWAYTGTCYQFQ